MHMINEFGFCVAVLDRSWFELRAKKIDLRVYILLWQQPLPIVEDALKIFHIQDMCTGVFQLDLDRRLYGSCWCHSSPI